MNRLVGSEVIECPPCAVYPAPCVPDAVESTAKGKSHVALVLAAGACRRVLRFKAEIPAPMPYCPAVERKVREHRRTVEHGTIVAQVNAEDVRQGVAEYLTRKLRIETIELRLAGIDVPDIRQRRITDLDEALARQRGGQLITPRPDDPNIQAAFREGAFPCFVRRAPLDAMDRAAFLGMIGRVRQAGVQHVGAYLAVESKRELELAMEWGIEARLDLLSFEWAGSEEAWPRSTLIAEACDIAAGYVKSGCSVPLLGLAADFAGSEAAREALALGAPFFRMARQI